MYRIAVIELPSFQTVDNIAVRVGRYDLAEDSIVRVIAVVLAWTSGNHASTWRMDYSFKRDGLAAVDQIGSGDKAQQSLGDGSNWNVNIVRDASGIEFELIGDMTKTVEWGGSLEIFTMAYSP